jgi:hypothetical protein
MKFSNYILATIPAMISLSAASSAPLQTLSKRANSASCEILRCGGPDVNNNAEIWVNTRGEWGADFGAEFLKHLRNQCGAIYGWGFDYDKASTVGRAHFWSGTGNVCNYNNACWEGHTNWCSSHCVEDAIWLASEKRGGAIEGVGCRT